MANELREVLKDLAKKGEHDIVRRIYQMNLIKTMQLINSIKADVIANSNKPGVKIEYNYVSVFIETGTGKGQSLGQKGPRSAKQIISPIVKEIKLALVEKILDISSNDLINLIKLEFQKKPRE